MTEDLDLSEPARTVLEHVADNPYSRQRTLAEETGLEPAPLEEAIEDLVEGEWLLTMTRQSGSSHESRVAEEVYLVNPEREGELVG